MERRARNISLDNLERISVAFGVAVYELLMQQPDFEGKGSDSDHLVANAVKLKSGQ